MAGLVTLASIAISGQAICQKAYEIGAGGGAVIPVGKLSDVQKTGYNGIVILAIGAADLPIGLRFDGIYNNLLHNNLQTPGGTPTSDFRVIGALGNLIYAFPGTTVKPYIIVGGGLYNTKLDLSGAKAENHFGFNAGLGATFGMGPFATFLESRYHTVSRSVAKGGVVQFVPITIGLMF